jgi:uncharacterized membrane protein YgdD (TMEM256/DUF423 family)
MVNLMIALGAFNAFLADAAGAFAAHLLKGMLTVEYLNVFKTAAHYQLIHGVGLIIIALLTKHDSNRCNIASAIFMFIGIVLFSGSLYLLAITGIKWLGMITPVGGVCFLMAWLILGFNYLTNRE